MEISWAQNRGDDKHETDAGVHSAANDTEHEGLAQGANKGEDISDKVELAKLETNRISNEVKHSVIGLFSKKSLRDLGSIIEEPYFCGLG